MSPRTAQAIRGLEGDHAELLRTHLLATTERLLTEHSPGTLTTRRIARAAGVSDGVLYNHFADKDALVLAAMTRRFSRALDRFRAAIPKPGSATLARNLSAIAGTARQLQAELLPMLGALLSDEALLRRFLLQIHREDVGAADIVVAIDRYLAAERELGRVGDADTRVAAELLVGGVAVRGFSAAHGGPGDTERLVATLASGLEPPS